MEPRYGKLSLKGGARRFERLVPLTEGRLEHSLVLYLCPEMELIVRDVKFATFLSYLSMNRGWKRCYLTGPNSLVVSLGEWIPQVVVVEDKEILKETSVGYVELKEAGCDDLRILASEEVFLVNFKKDETYPVSWYLVVAIISFFLAFIWGRYARSRN